MLYLGIFLILLFFTFNGFCIAKLFKKFEFFTNSAFAMLAGIFLVFGFCQIIFTLLYVTKTILIVYYYVIGFIQLFALIVYILNYKLFFSLGIEWKRLVMPLITFAIAILFVCLYTWGLTYNQTSDDYQNLNKYLASLTNQSFYAPITLNNGVEFSTLNIFSSIFYILFKSPNTPGYESLFIKWAYVILYAFCVTACINALLNRMINKSLYSNLLCLFLETIFLFFTFISTDTPALGETWIGILIGFYWYATFMENNKTKINYLGLIFLSFFSFSSFIQNCTMLVSCLAIFTLFYLAKNQRNTILFIVETLIIIGFQVINSFYIWQRESLWIIYDIVLVFLFMLFYLLANRSIYYSLSSKICKFINENIQIFYFVLVAVIYFLSIYFVVHDSKYIDFYLYKYEHIWNIKLSDSASKYFNIGLWVFYAICVISWVVYLIVTKKQIFETYTLLYYVFIIGLFVNPICMQMLVKAFSSLSAPDVSLVNYLLIFPAIFEFRIPQSNKNKQLNII